MKKDFSSLLLTLILVLGLILTTATVGQAKTEWKMALGDAAGGTQWALGE